MYSTRRGKEAKRREGGRVRKGKSEGNRENRRGRRVKGRKKGKGD